MYFMYGPGGTGKTFLWSTIISKLRSEGKIVVAVASSGIASLLLDGGRTAHSHFKIPIDMDEFSCCDNKQNTYLAELICNTSLVIWDKAPMHHRYIFEAVDHTFRDIRRDAQSLPFGGIPVLLCGDFRQTLPVVPKKGDGSEPTFLLGDDPDPSWIKIPDEVRVNHKGDALEANINEIYGELYHMHGDIEYLRDRAILTPLNEFVDSANNEVLKRLPRDFKVYKSCDGICKASSSSIVDEALYPPEYLNCLRFSGVPNHEIRIKAGAPIMLFRNLNPKKGLCNGTRLIITWCYPFVIEALIITGNKIGETTYIPRINMSPADKTFPFLLKRKQFPVVVSYAMTINKSQCQTVKNVGLYLPKPFFSHGHFYVAVSRVTSPKGLKITCVDRDTTYVGHTKNIVCREIFDNIM
ncbi:uncharacterized protein LOC141679759 [Apium graveolens]|uniref:uncharacterized protein LOC141679759 n=1 Tax=Apium graveolens TaxID=4045 RepID=UPI003D7B0B6B